jgi:hypothetical protein
MLHVDCWCCVQLLSSPGVSPARLPEAYARQANPVLMPGSQPAHNMSADDVECKQEQVLVALLADRMSSVEANKSCLKTHHFALHDGRTAVLSEASLQPRCSLCVRVPRPAMQVHELMTWRRRSTWRHGVIVCWVHLSSGYPPCQRS